MFSMIEVWRAWRRSAERVSSTIEPSAFTTRRLEEAEAERVVAGQPVHALLREQQHGVELLLGHLDHQPVAAGVEFGAFEMQSHQLFSKTIADIWRP